VSRRVAMLKAEMGLDAEQESAWPREVQPAITGLHPSAIVPAGLRTRFEALGDVEVRALAILVGEATNRGEPVHIARATMLALGQELRAEDRRRRDPQDSYEGPLGAKCN
jgi:prolyl-tRNA editing enzyme YbaK/EbsC (Cys-tRNA(Pro) deacylase)